MTVQQKLALFSEKANANIKQQRQEFFLEMQDLLKEAQKTAETTAQKEAAEQIRLEKQKSDRELQKRVQEAKLAARQKLANAQKNLANELLAELKNDLYAFTASPAYSDYILEGIVKHSELGFKIVQLMARDKSYKEAIEAETNFRVELTEDDFIGGFKLMSENRRMIADFSLLNRLEELFDEQNFWNKWADTNSS